MVPVNGVRFAARFLRSMVWFKQSCYHLFNHPLSDYGRSDVSISEIATWLPTYDNNWYQRWMNNGINSVVMGRTVYLLSWCSLFFTLGYYKFKKRNIKLEGS